MKRKKLIPQSTKQFATPEEEISFLKEQLKRKTTKIKHLENLHDELTSETHKRKLQFRAAIEAKLTANNLCSEDLWLTATLVKQIDLPTAIFVDVASRWALGLPIDSETLKELGILTASHRLNPSFADYKREISNNKKYIARREAIKEISSYLIPLLDSLQAELIRLRDSIPSSHPSPHNDPHKKKLELLSQTIGNMKEMLHLELDSSYD